MIKKAFFSFFCFLTSYIILIAIFPNKGVGTHQWQENQIRAHQFLYEKTSDTVLIGTSLSARLLLDSLNTVCSCAFSASVVEDGLRLLLLKEQTPRFVLLETNYLLRPSNGDIIKVNTQGPLPTLRRIIPVLREQNSPISLVGFICMRDALTPTGEVDIERLERNIENRISDDHTHYLTETQMTERINTIQSLIRQVESRGSIIVLFEMPLNKRIVHTPSNDQTRQVVHRMFPPEMYNYLTNDTSSYLTNDGEHLDSEGQRRYSHFLRNELKSMLVR